MNFLILITIFNSSCFLNYDKFTSAEIAIPFKSISDRDNVVIKSNIFMRQNRRCLPFEMEYSNLCEFVQMPLRTV